MTWPGFWFLELNLPTLPTQPASSPQARSSKKQARAQVCGREKEAGVRVLIDRRDQLLHVRSSDGSDTVQAYSMPVRSAWTHQFFHLLRSHKCAHKRQCSPRVSMAGLAVQRRPAIIHRAHNGQCQRLQPLANCSGFVELGSKPHEHVQEHAT